MGLQLVAKVGQKIHIVYENPFSTSSYGCRPLRLWFVSENKKTATEEIKRLKAEVKAMKPFECISGIRVNFRPIFSMNDLKMENFKWENSCAMHCAFCGATPYQFHLYLEFYVDPEKLEDFCQSPLHFLIRLVEHFFKVFH